MMHKRIWIHISTKKINHKKVIRYCIAFFLFLIFCVGLLEGIHFIVGGFFPQYSSYLKYFPQSHFISYYEGLKEQREIPIQSVVIGATKGTETLKIGDLLIRFYTDPEIIKANESVDLSWEITDHKGRPVALETTIHGTPIHVYGMPDGFSGMPVHIHPPQSFNPDVWSIDHTMPSGGQWNIVLQTALDGIFYHIYHSLEVVGENTFNFEAHRQEMEKTTPYPLVIDPAQVRVGIPSTFTFDVSSEFNTMQREYLESLYEGSHNILFYYLEEQEPIIWNAHGDASVDDYARQVSGVFLERQPTEENLFVFGITFDKPGLWVMVVELGSHTPHYFIDVGE